MNRFKQHLTALAACFICVACVKSSAGIKEISSPGLYSAGRKSANEIASWMNRELPPEIYDIWHKKKARIYLNGSWKLIKLSGTSSGIKNNYGENRGFAKPGYDDKNWFNQPVPWMWNMEFPEGKLSSIAFSGIGWYRKHVNISKNLVGNKCFILHFEAVDDQCEVFVNGEKVAENTILTTGDSLTYGPRHSEAFSADITRHIKSGDNVIAVKVYDDGKNRLLSQQKRDKGVGGIWQEVYIDIVPQVYQTKTLVSPDLKKSGIQCKSFIVNTTGKTYSANLKVKLSPWSSPRYKLANFSPQTISIGDFSLKPGKNEIDYFVKIENPVTWSPENPNLYHFQLEDSKYGIIGQERFGYREFTVGKQSFKMNGIPINIRCEQASWKRWESAPGFAFVNRLGYMNCDRIIEITHKGNLNVNFNMVRTHSFQEPHNFQDIADELGLMIYPEEPSYTVKEDKNHYSPAPMTRVFDGKEISPFLKEKIRNNVFAAYNNPSVVMRSLGNELYDNDLFACKLMKTYKAYLESLYREYKRLDPTRPLSNSGRGPTRDSCNKTGARMFMVILEYAKMDFHDVHNYGMTWHGLIFAEDNDWDASCKKLYEALLLDDGEEKAVFNGETFISSLLMPYHGLQEKLVDFFAPHIKNGVFDRKWFVDNCQTVPEKIQNLIKGTLAFDRAAKKFGYIDSIIPARAMLSNARMLKDFIEQSRRNRDFCAGFALNQSKISIPATKFEYYEPNANYARVANQPALASLDLKFNKNMFAGKENSQEVIYIINDREEQLKNIEIKPFIKKYGSSHKIPLQTLKVASVDPGQVLKAPYRFALSDSMSSGNYYLTLEFYANGKKESENFYENLYVMNVNDVKLANKVKDHKIGVFTPAGSKNSSGVKQLIEVLNKLSIPYVEFSEMKQISGFDFIVIPPMVYTRDMNISPLGEWLLAGGKMVCFEQASQIRGLPGAIASSGDSGWTVELIAPEHPLFADLKKENFSLWNGNRESVYNKWLVKNAISPMNYGVLASFLGVGKRSVMAATDIKLGKGSCLQSQFIAVERFMTDSVATRLLLNIFNYTLGKWGHAVAVKESGFESDELKINSAKVFYVDLKPYANTSFRDDVKRDGKGWTDQGPENDFRNFPAGKQKFAGIPFNIINPSDNNNKSCIALRGGTKTGTEFLPYACQKIKIGREVSKLFFLVTGAWIPASGNIGKIQIVYEAFGQGMFATQDIPLIAGMNIKDWWNPATGVLSGGKIGWVGRTSGTKSALNEIGAYVFEWDNPDTSRKILHINIYSARRGVPIILGITGEGI